jgi:hypothetical protein
MATKPPSYIPEDLKGTSIHYIREAFLPLVLQGTDAPQMTLSVCREYGISALAHWHVLTPATLQNGSSSSSLASSSY